MKEFDLIEKHFSTGGYKRKDVLIGIGDDAAVTKVPAGQCLVTTTDTLVEGVHFLKDTSPDAIAHKVVAVNLSDLSAMGAEPAWLSLSLSLPSIEPEWVKSFSEKLHSLSEYFSFQLIGGDTVQGPLSITVTAQGFIPEGNQITRSGASSGDWLMVTGCLGDAGVGLDILKGERRVTNEADASYLKNRHWFPTPRVLAGTTMRRIATSCIDVSDGLLQDVKHIASSSEVGVLIHLDKLPISQALGANVADLNDAMVYAATSGDDYELLFTVPEEQRVNIETALSSYDIPVACIGQITGAKGKIDCRLNDQPYTFDSAKAGFEHFS
ncbi:thiamine-phosphate kinase [Glaciecola sp. MH2013]|uniref:thiamine-phosphate kinase n=1 Tax=Glaciecola sp. MH2013 TaxID=2785524 RepID=UPI00189E6F21|nr:thiamine-phosphate kinase [Glaciecola sp. MH2013]MBF7074707.1 thiamine-phosphate kinase [Glaciecola sp. MH2013]